MALKWQPREATQLLNGLAQRCQATEALRTLEAMAEDGLEVNVVHLNVAIKACRRHWAEAIQLLFHTGEAMRPGEHLYIEVVELHRTLDAWRCRLAALISACLEHA